MRKIIGIGLILIGIIIGSYVPSLIAPVYFALGCTKRTCVVTENPGGNLKTFQWAAQEIVRQQRWVVIDGRCMSACTILADEARNRVCITKRATFEFHAGSVNFLGFRLENVEFDLPYSQPIARWVKSRGGLPSAKSGKFLVMRYGEARRFWQTCVRTGALLPDHPRGPAVRFLHFANGSFVVTL